MKYVFYFFYLVLNEIVLICFFESFCNSQSKNRYQFNQTYSKRKHFKNRLTGFKFEEKHNLANHFILNKNQRSFKNKRKHARNENLSNRQLINKHSNRNDRNDLVNGRNGLINRSHKRKHRRNRNRSKKIIYNEDDNESNDEESNKKLNNDDDFLIKPDQNDVQTNDFLIHSERVKNKLLINKEDNFLINPDLNDDSIIHTTEIPNFENADKKIDNKNDEIVLVANFSLINSDKDKLYLGNNHFDSSFTNIETTHSEHDAFQTTDYYSNGLDKNNFNNDFKDNYESVHQNTDKKPNEVTKKIYNFINRRRVLDEDKIKETSLSILNYLAIGLILFLIILQLMLLLYPVQGKRIKKKLHSKWRKYRGKNKKDREIKKKLLVGSDESDDEESVSDEQELINLKERKRSDKLNRMNKIDKKLHNENLNKLNQDNENYDLDVNLKRLDQNRSDYKKSQRKKLKSTIEDNEYRQDDKNKSIKNNRNDKRISEQQIDESSDADVEINLNKEPTVEKQEEIKLKRPKKLEYTRKTSDLSNLNEKVHLGSIIKVRSEELDEKNLEAINKLRSPFSHAKIDLAREAKLVPKLKWHNEEPTDDLQKNRNLEKYKKNKVPLDDQKYEKDTKKDDKDQTDDRKQAQNEFKLRYEIKENVDNLNEDKKDQIEYSKDVQKDVQKKSQKENEILKTTKIFDEPEVKKVKEIEQIPVNWLTIVGNKRVHKKNMAFFEKGNEVNILRLKPPNFADL